MSRHFAITVALAGSICLSSCVASYRNLPSAKVGVSAPSKAYAKLYYHVADQTHDAGTAALVNAIKTRSPFRETESIDAPPAQGLFIAVSIKRVPEGPTALTYKAISYATLTVLPAWSGRSGSDLLYEIYLDGRKMKNFDYQVRRKKVTWIGLLPFSWINLLAHTEAEVFDATALQFFDDADPVFRTATTSAP